MRGSVIAILLAFATLGSYAAEPTRDTLPDAVLTDCLSVARDTLLCVQAGKPAPQVARPASDDPRALPLGVRVAYWHAGKELSAAFADQTSAIMNARMAAVRAAATLPKDAPTPTVVVELDWPATPSPTGAEAILSLPRGLAGLIMAAEKDTVRISAVEHLRLGTGFRDEMAQIIETRFKTPIKELRGSKISFATFPALVGVLSPDERATRLYRDDALLTDTAVTRESLSLALSSACAWLIAHQVDGLFPLSVAPDDAQAPARDAQRHPGRQARAASALAEASKLSKSQPAMDSARAALAAVLAKAYADHPQGEIGFCVDGRRIEVEDSQEALLAIVATGTQTEYRHQGDFLCAFLLYQQEADGGFRKVLSPPSSERMVPSWRPRKALRAWHAAIAAPAQPKSLTAGLSHELSAFWQTIAAERAPDFLCVCTEFSDMDTSLREEGAKLSRILAANQGMATSKTAYRDLRGSFTQQTADPSSVETRDIARACTALALAIRHGVLPEKQRTEATEALSAGLRALLQQQIRDAQSAWYWADGEKAVGGFRESVCDPAIRLTTQAAAVEALIAALQTPAFASPAP